MTRYTKALTDLSVISVSRQHIPDITYQFYINNEKNIFPITETLLLTGIRSMLNITIFGLWRKRCQQDSRWSELSQQLHAQSFQSLEIEDSDASTPLFHLLKNNHLAQHVDMCVLSGGFQVSGDHKPWGREPCTHMPPIRGIQRL